MFTHVLCIFFITHIMRNMLDALVPGALPFSDTKLLSWRWGFTVVAMWYARACVSGWLCSGGISLFISFGIGSVNSCVCKNCYLHNMQFSIPTNKTTDFVPVVMFRGKGGTALQLVEVTLTGQSRHSLAATYIMSMPFMA